MYIKFVLDELVRDTNMETKERALVLNIYQVKLFEK